MSAQRGEIRRHRRGRTSTAVIAFAMSLGAVSPATAQQETEPAAAVENEEVVERTRFYRPPGAVAASQVRMIEVELEAPLLVSREERLAAPWIGEPESLPLVARFAHSVEPGAGTRRVGGSAMRFEEVYLAYVEAARPAPGDRLLLVDVGAKVDELGRIITPRAVATVVTAGDPSLRVRITDQFGPVLESVVALPIPALESVRGETVPVVDGPIAHLVAFQDETVLHGPAARAFVSLGSDDGVSVGDEFMAYVPGRESEGGDRVQSEPVALLRVIRAEPRSSTVRVLNLAHPVLGQGLPVVMTRKVPRPAAP